MNAHVLGRLTHAAQRMGCCCMLSLTDGQHLRGLATSTYPRSTPCPCPSRVNIGPQVLQRYSAFVTSDNCLSSAGFQQSYEDGAGDPMRDLHMLGLALAEVSRHAVRKAGAQEATPRRAQL